MIEELLNYQKKDAELRKIEQELSGSEERKKAIVAKRYLDGVEESVAKLDARAAKLVEEYQNALSEQEKLKEQEQEFVRAVESAEDDTEAGYILKKIEELAGKIKSETKAAQAQYTENGKKYNELKASVKEEREKVEAELGELAKKVDPALMERYQKKRAGKIYPVVYEVRGNVCGACNMELPMSEMSKLKNGEVIDCDQCGRLLYKGKN